MTRTAWPDGAQSGWTTALLIALLLVFAVLKLAYNPAPIGHDRADGTFYYQIAQHVAAGDGLLTSVSLFNQGLRDLPSETNSYPLWPLLLGTAGRFIDLHRAATLLPEILFLLSLWMIYALANRLVPDPRHRILLSVRGAPVVQVGHLALALLGSNRVYFRYTSVPWTEGLAFCLLFGALLAVGRARTRPPFRWGCVAGALAGLAYLTRSQLVGLPLAIAGSLLLVGLRRPAYRRAAAGALASAGFVLLPWLGFLISFVDDIHPRMLVDFAAYRETPALRTHFDAPSQLVAPQFDSLADRIADSATGLLHAFNPLERTSYVPSFGWAVYLLPIAALSWLGFAAGRRRLAREGLQPGALLPLATLAAAAACLLPVHLLHSAPPNDWFFHHRHGLPMILAIVWALCELVSRPSWLRIPALVLALSSVVVVQPKAISLHWKPAGASQGEQEMLRWLRGQEPKPVIVSTACRELSAWTRVRSHWIDCDGDPAQTRGLFEHLEIDYLILYPGEWGCRVVSGLESAFEPVAIFGPVEDRLGVFRWRG